MSAGPELKDTNPKDAIGSTKLPIHLVPSTAINYMALAFCEGATKYGAYNWRVAGVRASIYYSALQRHLSKWWNGEWADPNTNVPHLASALACIAIILDAQLVNKLTDDRPPAAPMSSLVDSLAEVVKHLQEIHAGINPRHYTIDDTQVWQPPPHQMPLVPQPDPEAAPTIVVKGRARQMAELMRDPQ
jgi:hypothetical protein